MSPAALAARPGVIATGTPKHLESTIPFGSSGLRAALDAALAAGPQAVAAEVGKLRQDAAGGSSAAIKILEESGDDLASRIANPHAAPSGPDVAGVAHDAMQIAAHATTPMDPRQFQDPAMFQAPPSNAVPYQAPPSQYQPAAVHDPTMYQAPPSQYQQVPQVPHDPTMYQAPPGAASQYGQPSSATGAVPQHGQQSSAMGAAQPYTYAGPSSAFSSDGELRMLPPDLYQIGDELARGGMGRILRARDTRLGRPVAIKALLGDHPAMKERFEREALITARLQHPAIVPIYEAGRWPTGELFFVMKLVAGRPLDVLIAAADTMRQRLALLPNVIAMAEALAYAHSNNVVHRDLKPANVLVGDFGETIVIDWGLAKDLSTAEPGESAGPFRAAPMRPGATVAGSVMGTPGYMPPEQGKGLQVDARADVYSIGALLYHVLAKRAPYDGPDPMAVLQTLLAHPPPPLAEIQPDVPPELVTIVNKAMARDPVERYPTAKELVEDLRRYQNGQMVAVHRYSTKDLIARWAKKHKGALLVATGAFVVLVVLGIFSITRVLDANKIAQQQRDEALANHTTAVSALSRAEQSEGRAKASEQTVIVERDRGRFARARRLEMNHFNHTQLGIRCQGCHPIDPTTFTAKIGSPGHHECSSCHDPKSMEGLRDDPKCSFCHLDRKATTKDRASLRACDDRAVTALKGAGGKATPCFRHDSKAHRIDTKGDPLECTNCHGVLADKKNWGKDRAFNTLNDLDRFTIIGDGAHVDTMHRACTTGCHHHKKHITADDASHNCAMCHPQREADPDAKKKEEADEKKKKEEAEKKKKKEAF